MDFANRCAKEPAQGRELSRAKRVGKTIRGILFCALFRRGKAVWGTAFLRRPLPARAGGIFRIMLSMGCTKDAPA